MTLSRRAVLALPVSAGLAACAEAAPAAAPAEPWAKRLIDAARSQIGVTRLYDPAYVRLDFPNGDVPPDRGVCTDVVIRAYRAGLGHDLQAVVNADMRAAFSAYPRRWGLSRPDRNIDHRRVPNLQTFWRRRGAALETPSVPTIWAPGDLVTQLIGGNLPHVGVVSDRRTASGRLLVIHNAGRGTQEEDILELWPVTGRFRYAPARFAA